MEKTGEQTELVPGARGEFTVWADGQQVAGKGPDGFPNPEQVVLNVRGALA